MKWSSISLVVLMPAGLALAPSQLCLPVDTLMGLIIPIHGFWFVLVVVVFFWGCLVGRWLFFFFEFVLGGSFVLYLLLLFWLLLSPLIII